MEIDIHWNNTKVQDGIICRLRQWTS